MRVIYRSGFILITLIILSVYSALAQDACPALVEQALQSVGNNCAGLGRNSACYGFNRVDASFTNTVEDSFFSKVSDTAILAQLDTIRTAGLDEANGEWGIAVMNVQANLPNTLPGQGVIFLLVGDAEIQNAVKPEELQPEAEPVTVTTLVPSNLRSGPGPNTNIVNSVPTGTELLADGLSPDNQWLRIVYKDRPAWISRQLVDEPSELNLPNISDDVYSPMQSFYLSTGLGQPACEEAPADSLLVQGPKNINVDLTVNGAKISLGSTLVFRVVQPGDVMELLVVDGHAEVVDPETGEVQYIPAGFKSKVCISEEDGQTLITCGWSPFEPIPPEELEDLKAFEGIPGDLLYYDIEAPTIQDIQQYLNAVSGGGTGGTGGGSGGGGTQTVIGGGDNCAGFALTSPLNDAPNGLTTVYWNVAPGANSYVVNLYKPNGGLGSSTPVSNVASAQVNFNQAGQQGEFVSWEVVAYSNEQQICVAKSGGVQIVGGGSNVDTSRPFAASWSCKDYDLVVSWTNAGEGDDVTIIVDSSYGTLTGGGTGPSGSSTFNDSETTWYSATVTTSSGKSETLNGPKYCY